MLGKNHATTAIASWVLSSSYLLDHQPQALEALLLAVVVGFGSLLPDADHPDSLLGRRVKFISVPLSYLQGDRAILPWSEHTHSRGITHSIWALLACYWLVATQQDYATALAFGFAAHLIGDALTPAGVRLLWPISTTFRFPLTFRTGGFVEYGFTYGLLIAAAMHLLGFNLLHELFMLVANS
ncbi:metal-dependent hydrolase [Pseudoalteromonas sp. SR45-4]|uniref:metal-dependent hydrolase n=1 Tax=Pseudoalteromonas sp. SR45-4 TaxID=2760929 RepID=UPI0015FD6B04|nr:metal-dependent hydrolase [Pseudoalteromonas sp. SR45-4]MBB1371986.1 metal-dependent hydrolase [Pseudoalteromonas sp. SR45-4]